MTLGSIVPFLQELDLSGSCVEVDELVFLGQMRQLQRLKVDTKQCDWESEEVLVTALHAACLGCLHLRELWLVVEVDDEDYLCGEVRRVLADSGRGDVRVVECFH